MSATNRIRAIPLTSFDAAELDGTPTAINDPAGLDNACVLLRIINDSDVPVWISYDGVTDHDYVMSQSVSQIYFQTNSQPNNKVCKAPRGTKVYMSGNTGTGYIYLSGYYIEE